MEKFKKIYIEVTNCCNLSCSFCHQSDRPKSFMDADRFTDVLEKIHHHTKFIYLHVLGEALLHPEFELLLEISHRFGLHVNLSSNGTLFSQKGDLLLAGKSLRQVNISLHSFEHSEEPVLEEYISGILAFVDKVQQQKIPVWLNLRLWDIQHLHTGASGQRNTEILRRLQDFFHLPVQFAAGLAPGRSLTLAPGIFLSQERQFNWPHRSSELTGRNGSCRGLRDHIAILVDGTVVPCCLDAEADIALGNIHRQSLDRILSSPRASRMRTGFSRQQLVEPLCQRCNYRCRFE